MLSQNESAPPADTRGNAQRSHPDGDGSQSTGESATGAAVADIALAYAARGWRVAPIKPGTSWPCVQAWQEVATTDPEQIRQWWGAQYVGHGISIVTGHESGIFVLDVDVKDGKVGAESLASLEATHGKLPDTAEVLTPSGGRHLYFRHPGADVHIKTSACQIELDLDIRGDGGHVVAPPSIHPKVGTAYEWEISGDPFDGVAVAEAPQWLIDAASTTHPSDEQPRRTASPRAPGELKPGDEWAEHVSWPDLLLADGAVYMGSRNAGDGTSYELWGKPGGSGDHHHATLYYKGSDSLHVFTGDWGGAGWSLTSDTSYSKFGYYCARHHGDPDIAEHRQSAARSLRAEGYGTDASTVEDVTEVMAANGQSYTLDDDGNARRFVDSCGDDYRWVSDTREWCAFDDDEGKWADDYDGSATRCFRMNPLTDLRTEAGAPSAPKKLLRHADSSGNVSRIRGALELARSAEGMTVRASEFDVDPMILGVSGGVLDLDSGTFRRGDRSDLVTRSTGVTYAPDASCPTWARFLAEVLPSPTVRDYMQAWVGSTLTGHSPHVLMFGHGPGANGKSVLMNTVQSLLGVAEPRGYAATLRSELLLQTREGKRHMLAELPGVRLVVTSELNEGEALDESQVKSLTGGDRINGRANYGRDFSFAPSHTLAMVGNHLPTIRGTDDGIWRRLHLVPFDQTIPEADRDATLPDKLLAELPGILNWAMDGVGMFMADRQLTPPAEIADATSLYRAEADPLGRWLSECTVAVEGAWTAGGELHSHLRSWCEQEGAVPPSKKALTQRLKGDGFVDQRKRSGRGFAGIGLVGPSGVVTTEASAA